MKEHRTKALRVTTPHSIQSNDLDVKYRCCGCEDEDSDLLDMLQFDLVPSRNSGLPSDDFYFCRRHRYQQQQQPQQPQPQPPPPPPNKYGADYIDSTLSPSTPMSTQYRIVATSSTAVFTASTTAVAFTKNDGYYRWFSYEFQSNNDATRAKKKENKSEPETSSKLQNVDCGCHRPVHLTNVEEKAWLQTREICRCHLTWCGRKLAKHEKLLSLSSSSSSSSISKSFSQGDRFLSILDLVSGVDSDNNWLVKIKRIKEAIDRENSSRNKGNRNPYECWYNLKDVDGNTALLVSGQKLLREGSYDKAVELATILLAEGSDVNVTNNENRTLLSYSIQYMDESIRLTTLLINYGANVWPMTATTGPTELPLRENRFGSGCGLAIEIEKYIDEDSLGVGNENNIGGNCNSAFACFLVSIIKRLKLSDRCFRTLFLLAEVMGERPDLMRSHVMSTMFRHAKCYSILGPVFLQIKLAVSPYWAQPQTLKYLCKSVIRKSIFSVPGRFVTAENMSSLMLPPPLESYIMLEDYS